jgi:hypothetical protein
MPRRPAHSCRTHCRYDEPRHETGGDSRWLPRSGPREGGASSALHPGFPAARASSFKSLGKTQTHSCDPAWSRSCRVTVRLLIDECLHTSLVEVSHAAGHLADHVNYLGLGSSKDWQLMATIRAQDHTFVTNNRFRFSCSPRTRTAARRCGHCCSQRYARSSARTLHCGAETYRREI